MRSRVWVCAAAAAALLTALLTALLLALAPGVAGASPSIQPDVNGSVPGARLSPSGVRAALRSVARRLPPGGAAQDEQWITVGSLTFVIQPFSVGILPPGQRTLYFCPDVPTPLIDTGVHDAAGVRMVLIDGTLWNHVSAQARYGLDNVNAYRASDSAADRAVYLARAEVQAQRLIDRSVAMGDAWLHPYSYVWGSMQPPWYSALGQGYALSLFIRLYELTGDASYKTAADATFASFLDAGPTETPWVSDVDPSGHLWLQEYPGSASECVFNGDMVAALGLYDYYRVTADPRALALFRGAATTVVDYTGSYRRAGWRSLYCLGDSAHTANPGYHEVVVQQLLAFFAITADPRFARWADTLENDYPRSAVSGTATVAAGKHTVLHYAGTGRIVGRRAISSQATLHLAVSARERIHGRPGYWLLIAGGPWRGYWIEEQAPKVYVAGQLVTLPYAPSRSLTLPGGKIYAFHHYSVDGAVTATLHFSPTAAATMQVNARAVVNGRAQVRASSGRFSGYWVRLKGCSLT